MAHKNRTHAELKGLPRPQARKREWRSPVQRARRTLMSVETGPLHRRVFVPGNSAKVQKSLILRVCVCVCWATGLHQGCSFHECLWSFLCNCWCTWCTAFYEALFRRYLPGAGHNAPGWSFFVNCWCTWCTAFYEALFRRYLPGAGLNAPGWSFL